MESQLEVFYSLPRRIMQKIQDERPTWSVRGAMMRLKDFKVGKPKGE